MFQESNFISITNVLVILLLASSAFAMQASTRTVNPNPVATDNPVNFSSGEENPNVVGDLSILSEFVQEAPFQCQRIAVVGDSQETHPTGSGRQFFSRLIVNAFNSFGPASETELCFSETVFNRGLIVTHHGTDFQDSVALDYTILPGTRISAQSDSPNGFAAVLAPRGQRTGINNPSATLEDLEDWFTFTDLRAEYIFMGNPSGPDYMRIQYRPTSPAAPHWSRPIRYQETRDHSLSTIGDGVFIKYRTPNLPDSPNPAYIYPQVIVRSTDGHGTIALGGRCAGMRWVDHARNQGVVFQSFGLGGATTTSWLSRSGHAHPQFQAYGPWSQIWIAFGANDASDKDKAAYKTGLQALIDRFHDSDWQQNNVPIVLLTDFARKVAGEFSAAKAETLRTEYWEAIRELCEENENVVGINSLGLMENAGYDPNNAEHTADGVHLTTPWNWNRADLIWQTILDPTTVPTIDILGDANGDGSLNNLDIASFVMALSNQAAYQAIFPETNPSIVLDMNGDGVFDNLDIAGFVSALVEP